MLATDIFATNGYFAHGYGTRYKGMAGAGTALSLGPLGVATNPASLSFLGKELYLGAALFNPNREYTVKGNPSGFPFTFGLAPGTVESGSKVFVVPSAAVSLPISGGSVLGLAIYGNGGMNTNYDAPTFGAKPTGVDLVQLFVAGTFATQFAPGQAVGVTGIFSFQRFKAEGLGAFGGFSSDASKLTNNDYSNSTGFGARVGYMGKFGDLFSVGASYQTKISMSQFDEYAGLFAEQGDFDIPASWNVGIAIHATPKLTFAADVQQIMYSDIKSIANRMDLQNNPPFIPNPNADPQNPNTYFMPNPNFKPLGSDDGWGFGWEDMTVYKFGVQFQATEGLTLRGGFSTGSQPIPTSEVLFNILAPGVIEQHITVGFTKVLTPKVSLNGSVMYAPSNTVEGPNQMEAPGQQTIELKMNQFEGELSVSIAL